MTEQAITRAPTGMQRKLVDSLRSLVSTVPPSNHPITSAPGRDCDNASRIVANDATCKRRRSSVMSTTMNASSKRSARLRSRSSASWNSSSLIG